MATWTRQELEALHPQGEVGYKIDDELHIYDHDEWDAWIESQVGEEKPNPEFEIPA